MSKTHRVFAFLFVILFLASAAAPVAFNDAISDAKLLETSYQPAASTYNVDVRIFNHLMAFNDDDFEFTVWNGSIPLNNAWVRLYSTTTDLLETETQTNGIGVATFYNLALGPYKWNVSHDSDVVTPDATGLITSDGPEADVVILFGNIDWDNDDDDLNATITDIEDNPANNLNFSIHRVSDGSIYDQVEVIDGRADFQDITPGNYTWKLSVLGGPVYDGYLLEEGDVESNGTQLLLHQSIGPLIGDPYYFDLEIFTYYETSLIPIVGADVVLMYKNGSVIDTKVTPTNGTVIFIDLPVAFVNWSVTFGGQPVGLEDYWYNLTTVSSDVRDPVITTPGDQSFLIDAENVTLTWTIEDDFPSSIELWVDGELNVSISWVNSTREFVYNISSSFQDFVIGNYEIKLVAIDHNLNFAEDTVNVRLYENVTPIIEGPDPVEFYFSETGYTLSWNITDDYLNMYDILRNDEDFLEGTINPDEPVITISLDGLAIGVHNFTMYANDTSGNTAIHSVLVTVLSDDVVPILVYAPPDISYAQGDTNLIYSWTATDDFKDYYTIAVDGEIIITADWTTDDIEFDFSGLIQGEHEVTLKVYDLGANMVESTVLVHVSAPTAIGYLTSAGLIAIGAIIFIALIWFVRYR
ncbi:MAG: hypothetical protein E3J86_10965 [Candidatus Thorarchaeota archaeon]|nr:MAG: hypothetical protein E3J86_10965 [Candidatus Thorarchaeota archaeon]